MVFSYVKNRKLNSSMVFWKNLSETTMQKAKQQEGMTGDNLMVLLESRLDNVMFRMGFARTRKRS